jgi:hypothetical protein
MTELLGFWTLSIVRTTDKSENPVVLSVIHHRQNPLEFNYYDTGTFSLKIPYQWFLD